MDAAAAQADTDPTDAQKEAGNYRKGHVTVQGLDISIKNAKGSKRTGTDPDGKAWSIDMPAHYGYIKRTEGADGDHVDVYIGGDTSAPQVWIIDQVDAATGEFDEHKVMIGFGGREEALATHAAAFSDGKGPDRQGQSPGGRGRNRKSDSACPGYRARGIPADTPIIAPFRSDADLKAYPRYSEAKASDPEAAAQVARDLIDVEVAAQIDESGSGRGGVPSGNGQSPTRGRVSSRTSRQVTTDKIDDFGQKLEGARKDTASTWKDRLEDVQDDQLANEPLSKSWPEPNYQKMLDEGAEAIATFKASHAPDTTKGGKKAGNEPVRFSLLRSQDRKSIWIGKKVGWAYIRLADGFPDVKAARTYIAENQEKLEAILAERRVIPGERRALNSPRVGADHRNGQDVTPEMFGQAFGFRGVQFGNYVEGPRRQADLNEAYDALMDMAGILGIPSQAISLNGELGLAFGARGIDGKAAFERFGSLERTGGWRVTMFNATGPLGHTEHASKAHAMQDAVNSGLLELAPGIVREMRKRGEFRFSVGAVSGWKKDVIDLLQGRLDPSASLTLGPVPEILQRLGGRGNTMVMQASKLQKVMKAHGRNLNPQTLADLPQLLANPVMILNNAGEARAGDFRLLLDTPSLNGQVVVAAIKLKGSSATGDVATVVLTVHEDSDIQAEVRRAVRSGKNLVRYVRAEPEGGTSGYKHTGGNSLNAPLRGTVDLLRV